MKIEFICSSEAATQKRLGKDQEKMESIEPEPVIKTDVEENEVDTKGNGNLKRKHGVDGSSDDENDFLGFDLGKWSNLGGINFRPSVI